MVEFISYSGRYPNLCRGTLILRINGKIVKWKNCLESGGYVWFSEDWEDHIEYGPWSVNVPSEYLLYKEEIEKMVNENIPEGCCGGCI